MSFTLDRLELGTPGGLLVHSDVLPVELAGTTPGGQPHTYSGLFDRYRTSAWGMHHAGQPPRFSVLFAYEPSEMLADLGDAVHPVEHNVVAHGQLQAFLDANLGLFRPTELSPREVTVSRLAMQFHDTGESTHDELRVVCGAVVGDITHGAKTPTDRATERRVLEKVFERYLSDLPDDLKTDALNLITHDPSVADAPHHHLSEASHIWGEFQSGLRAGTLALQEIMHQTSGLRVQQLSRMGKKVVSDSEKRLEQLVPHFPFIEPMLEAAEPLRDRILTEL